MLRFIAYAVPLLILLLALFGFTVELLDAEPRSGSVIRLALFEQPRVPGQLVIGTWMVEASGLIALFLLAQGRFGAWWLDGLVAGWVAWVFRGPLLVITIVVAARQPQDPWWKLAFGWWVLYSVCGLSLAILARRSGLASWTTDEAQTVSQVASVETEAQPPKVQPSENGEQPTEDVDDAQPVDETIDETLAAESTPESEGLEPEAEAVAETEPEAAEVVQEAEPEADSVPEPITETSGVEDSPEESRPAETAAVGGDGSLQKSTDRPTPV